MTAPAPAAEPMPTEPPVWDEVLSMIHAFRDEGRRQAVRDLSVRVYDQIDILTRERDAERARADAAHKALGAVVNAESAVDMYNTALEVGRLGCPMTRIESPEELACCAGAESPREYDCAVRAIVRDREQIRRALLEEAKRQRPDGGYVHDWDAREFARELFEKLGGVHG